MKPNHRAPPAEVSAAGGLGGTALFDAASQPLQDMQALHVAVPRGQFALSPSIPPGPMPQTPKHLRNAAAGGLRGLHAARSVPDFHDLYDVPGLDIAAAPGDPFSYDYDFPDPLSPTFYDMPLGSAQPLMVTSELSSVGSATSNGSSFMSAPASAPPVEGLGIAEPGWPPVSPRSRAQNQPRITKKTSKQTLRQKRSRANLDQAAAGSDTRPASDQQRPSSPAPSTSTSSSAALSPPFPTSPRSPIRVSSASLVSAAAGGSTNGASGGASSGAGAGSGAGSAGPGGTAATAPGQLSQQMRNMPTLRHVPSTPFPVRGKAAASPAMQSPMRPSASRPVNSRAPRLPAAAAATALYTPAAPPPDPSRRTAMAAAAAAAAASATQSTTPGSRTPRVSPSTIVASTSGRGPQQNQGAVSPTPAARMHSSSKLVSAASDSSPAKGMFSQAPQAPLPLSALPKPVQTTRKMPSNQSMRRGQTRKQPNIIPEMSSAMNQFQVELKPQQPRKATTLPSARPASSMEFPALELMNSQHPQHPAQHAPPLHHQQHPGMKPPLAQLGNPPRSKSVGTHLHRGEPMSDMGQMFFDAPSSHQPWLFPGPPGPPHPAMPGQPQASPVYMQQQHQQQAQQSHQQKQQQQQQAPVHPQMHPQMNALPPQPPQFARPKTVVPVSNETSRVHPQGEPPQHVWVAHPPPPGTPRRRTPRQVKPQPSAKTPDVAAQPPPPMPAPPSQPFQQSGGIVRPHSSGAPLRSNNGPMSVPLLPQSSPQQSAPSQLMLPANSGPVSAPPIPSRPLMGHSASLPHQPAAANPSETPLSADDSASMPIQPSMIHPGLAMPPDMLRAPESMAMEGPPLSDQETQEPPPLQELNEGLPSDNSFVDFTPAMNYSNQEFLDSLEWAPTELDIDPQWDFMDVLGGEI